MTDWDPGLDFHRFLVDFGNLLGVEFYQFYVFFLGTRLSILSVSSEVCFLMGLGVKMVPGSVVGCADVRFHFFTYLVNWLIFNRLLCVFLVGFWVPWIHFL